MGERAGSVRSVRKRGVGLCREGLKVIGVEERGAGNKGSGPGP